MPPAMETLCIAGGTLLLYLLAYHTYGRWLARRVFQLDPERPTPAITQADECDYVPTAKGVVFGHHFTSIAGTGPIVGPALAVIWGWVPAILWVIFGSILIGAVHDFGALVVSMRSRGQTLGEIAGQVLSPRSRSLFLSILFLALTVVLAIFGLVIAAVFQMFPSAIFPCLVQIPLATAIGLRIHRRGRSLLLASLTALVLMMLSVWLGDRGPLGWFNETLAGLPVVAWVGILLLYAYLASVLPVWVLLQPRDYINALQLLSVVGLLTLGLVSAACFGTGSSGASLEIVAPRLRLGADHPPGAPWLFPFLFITVACGAVSGFHCLVASGTSSKQLMNERDALAVGYGSMLTEGFLAVLVILACVAGIGLGVPEIIDGQKTGETLLGEAAYQSRYATWRTAEGLGAKVGAFIDGSANFLRALGLPSPFAISLMGVFVASFAATTLDSACRLQRYVIQELATTTGWRPLRDKHIATLFAIAIAAALAALPAPGQPWEIRHLGQGGLLLWPLFGATNQLLGGLAFLVIVFWLKRRRLPLGFAVIPGLFMLAVPAAAMLLQLFHGPDAWLLGPSPNLLLGACGLATLGLEAWMVLEAWRAWKKIDGPRDVPDP